MKMKIGDQINVLLPWYADDAEQFVKAAIVDIRKDAIQIEYYSNRDERKTLWIDMDNLAYTQEMK
jgi:hypothetical protein